MSHYHRALRSPNSHSSFSWRSNKSRAVRAPVLARPASIWRVIPHHAGAGFLKRGGNPTRAFHCGPKPRPPGPGGSQPSPSPMPGPIIKPGE
jgi:hypothetical protein